MMSDVDGDGDAVVGLEVESTPGSDTTGSISTR